MLNTKSSLTAPAPYFQSSQNIFPAYPRISASSSDNFYLPSDGAGFSSNPAFLPFVPRSEGHAFPTGLVGGSLAGDAGGEAWRGMPTGPAAACWPYDSLHSFHYAPSYGGLDVRRKNATRESTSTLKAWLYEHIKNPYPTKGEKIMLAIITKMTLTQVSTWFANARRRLKKENKMQWSPRNRTGEDDDDDDDDDKNSDVIDERRDDDVIRRRNDVDDDEDDDEIIVDTDQQSFIPFPISIVPSPYLPSKTPDSSPPKVKSPIHRCPPVSPHVLKQKPRIWSLADVATSGLEDKGDTGEDSKPAVIKSTLQSLSDEDQQRISHENKTTYRDLPHRTSGVASVSSTDAPKQSLYHVLSPLHKLHNISGSQLTHLHNLYRSHLVRPSFYKRVQPPARRLSPRSDESADSTSNKNFETRQHLYHNGTTMTIPSQIR